MTITRKEARAIAAMCNDIIRDHKNREYYSPLESEPVIADMERYKFGVFEYEDWIGFYDLEYIRFMLPFEIKDAYLKFVDDLIERAEREDEA